MINLKICPRVENKYDLDFNKLKDLKLKDRTLVKEPFFWRNEKNRLWCYSKPIANGETEFWIRIKDDDKIVIHCASHDNLYEYKFDKFFDLSEINSVYEYILQEELLATVNTFIDEGIFEIQNETEN